MARTEIPRRPFQSPDVAQKEMLRRARLERNQCAGGGIRNEKHSALGAECRDLNRSERRHENIRRREPDPALQPRRQVRRGKALAAKMPGKVAGSNEDNRFALHEPEITTRPLPRPCGSPIPRGSTRRRAPPNPARPRTSWIAPPPCPPRSRIPRYAPSPLTP